MRLIFFLCLCLTFLLFSLASCIDGASYFKEYQDRNLIEDLGFYDAALPEQIDRSYFWQLTDEAQGSNFAYLEMEEVSNPDLLEGLPEGEKAARLRLVNLAPNGRFESDPETHWEKDSNATDEAQMRHLDSANAGTLKYLLIDGAGAYFLTSRSIGGFTFNLNQLSDFNPLANYRLLFDFRSDSSFFLELYSDQKRSKNWECQNRFPNTKELHPEKTFPFPNGWHEYNSSLLLPDNSNNQYHLHLGTSDEPLPASPSLLDNFRILRTDILRNASAIYACEALVPLEQNGRPPLISANYRFSVLVRSDPQALSGNSFQAQSISLGIGIPNQIGELQWSHQFKAIQCGGPLLEQRIENRSEMSSWANANWNDSWTEISFDFFIQVDSENNPALRLLIVPSDLEHSNNEDIGSLLLASPRLEIVLD